MIFLLFIITLIHAERNGRRDGFLGGLTNQHTTEKTPLLSKQHTRSDTKIADQKLELYKELKKNQGLYYKLQNIFDKNPLDVQFGLQAEMIINKLIEIKENIEQGNAKLISAEDIKLVAVSQEAVQYIQQKLQSNDQKLSEEASKQFGVAQDGFDGAEEIKIAMKKVEKLYQVHTAQQYDAIFDKNTIEDLLRSPLSTEYLLSKLRHFDNKKFSKSDQDLKKKMNDLKSKFIQKQTVYESTRPQDVTKARVLLKQREVLKNEMPHDASFVVIGVVLGAYSIHIVEIAAAVVGSALAGFTFLKMLINNGHNAKEMFVAISQSLDEASATYFEKEYYNTVHSDVFQQLSRDVKNSGESIPVNFNTKGDAHALNVAKSDKVTEKVKAILNDEKARTKLLAIIQQEGLAKTVIDQMGPDQKKNIMFLADASAAMLRLQPTKDGEIPEISQGDFDILSHPAVIDQAQSYLQQRINEIKYKHTHETDESIKSNYQNTMDELKKQKQRLDENAGLTRTRKFFKVAAPFVKILTIVLKVSVKFYGIGIFADHMASYHESFSIAFNAAVEGLLKMSDIILGSFVLGSMASAIGIVFGDGIADKFKRFIMRKKPAAPTFDVDKLSENILKTMKVTETVDHFSLWRSICRPKDSFYQLKKRLTSPWQSTKDGVTAVGTETKHIYQASKIAIPNAWRRLLWVGSFGTIKYKQKYSKSDQDRLEKMKTAAQNMQKSHDYRQEVANLPKGLNGETYDHSTVNEAFYELSNTPTKQYTPPKDPMEGPKPPAFV
eukprot:NODE_210_length_12844_cov_1.045822.p1 type:complete len:778 gc:universal NODE_210_length_12844_cov_1.045822:11028-8695(-)